MRPIKFRAWNGKTMQPSFGYPIENLAQHPEITLMQFTGLKDRHDKEIYEGDILKAPNKVITQQYVKWDKDKAGFFVHAHNGSANKNFRKALSGSAHLREVIGNIYENKELLRESEE